MSPNVYKSCPNLISLEKWKISTTLQKLLKNWGDSGKIIVATGFEKCNKSPNLVTLLVINFETDPIREIFDLFFAIFSEIIW